MATHHHTILYIIAVSALFCSSCAGVAGRRLAYVEEHPAMPVEIKNAVANGWIVEGMTKDDVKAAWGRPASVVEDPAGSRWSYRRKYGTFIDIYEVRFSSDTVSAVDHAGTHDSRRRIFSF